MKALFILGWLVLGLTAPLVAQGRTTAVTSGTHDGFARIVLTFETPVDWTLSRTEDGYDLALKDANSRYDLSDVYRRITRDRLGAIYADPVTGHLRLRVECACFAIPFELRPGMLVIDIRDGTPPDGSSFELAADGTLQPPLGQARPDIRPAGDADVAATVALADAVRTAARQDSQPPLPFPSRDRPDFTGIRESLLREIGRRATDGVVDMAAELPSLAGTGRWPGIGQMQVIPAAGIATPAADRPKGALSVEGAVCVADARLDVAAWGAEGPVDMAIGPARDGLMGEFDRTDTEATARAVRFLLWMGFGAEARMLAATLAPEAADRALWDTMARILDGEPLEGKALAGMEVCDGAAALWSVLSQPGLAAGLKPATGAILRGFSALPLHLRHTLGPPLADRFIAAGDFGTARAIRDAILRAPGDHGPGVRLMTAELDLAQGRDSAAHATLTDIAAGPGTEAVEATLALITQQVTNGTVVDAATSTAVEAYLRENRGGGMEGPIRTGLAIAYATQGRFDSAFDLLAEDEAARAPIWSMLAEKGRDADVLRRGVLAPSDLPSPDPARDRQMATRLIGLGFGNAAKLWLAPSRQQGNPADTILVAGADLARRDARAVLAGLAGTDLPDAARLRGRALEQLGDPGATAVYEAAGLAEDAAAAARRARQWEVVATLDPGSDWSKAAALLTPPAPDAAGVGVPVPDDPAPAGPLTAGRAAVAESTAARAQIAALLASVSRTDAPK